MANLTQAEIDEVVRRVFHEAWGTAHGQPDYDKRAWNYVQKYLDPAYRNQLPASARPSIKPDADGNLKLAGGAITIQVPK